MPQGTAPLQAAAFAAALMGDDALTEQLVALVAKEERDARELADFRTELTRVVAVGG
jgi:hypothetical protein